MSGVVVTGRGSVLDPKCDARPFLKVRKMRKFMGTQDALAVVAAGQALAAAGLEGDLGERAGLYLGVGYLPFVEDDIERLLTGAVREGAFSMEGFSSEGYNAVNPLITFRCLSNMPAFHVSMNFGIQGPYLVTYPGPGQLYLALEEACAALDDGSVEVALLGGVAHQDNFLVRHHFRRVDHPPERLLDGAAFLVLEREATATARGATIRARLVEHEVSYRPHHPLEEALAPREHFEGPGEVQPGELGPASLPVVLSTCVGAGTLEHTLETRDGFRASSTWELTG